MSPLRRSEYLGLRQAPLSDGDADCLLIVPALSEHLRPFTDSAIYKSISRYVLDLAAVINQLHRVVRGGAPVLFVVANNVIGGAMFPVSAIVEELMKHGGFVSVSATNRAIKDSRRRYPFGVNGFSGPMRNEYLVAGFKPSVQVDRGARLTAYFANRIATVAGRR